MLIWMQGGGQSSGSAFAIFGNSSSYANMLVVVPDTSTGDCGGWDMSDMSYISALIKELKTEYTFDSDHTILGGFSCGALGVSYYALKQGHQTEFSHLIMASGYIDFDLPAASASSPKVLLVHATDDTFVSYRYAEEAFASFKASGYDVDLRSTRGGHNLGSNIVSYMSSYLKKGESSLASSTMGTSASSANDFSVDTLDGLPFEAKSPSAGGCFLRR
ncbi:MAG: hypothetical protein HQL31_01480 [Planctomycetes bacterium]|nr:hypothetical protein [Planctomycetota bacterium]